MFWQDHKGVMVGAFSQKSVALIFQLNKELNRLHLPVSFISLVPTPQSPAVEFRWFPHKSR